MARPNKNQFARSGYCLALAMCIIAAMGCYFGPFYQAGFRPFMQYEKTRGVILAEDSTHCGRGPKFEPLVRYQYTVNGITYQGHQYVLGSQCGDPRMKPEYFKDKGVTVHYSAKRPSFSVLVLTWGNRTSALSLVGLCFLAAALYGWKLDLKLEK